MAEHPLEPIRRIDPRFMDHLKQTDELVFADGALPRKVKLLMAMAFDAAHGATNGVKALAQAARAAGASNEEIAESVRVACQLSGVGSVYTAAQALKHLA
jgi:alkylhydroperoxidase/carboxymuconolactone decarboxylase family protein YurZ